jgi:hypothetical protein
MELFRQSKEGIDRRGRARAIQRFSYICCGKSLLQELVGCLSEVDRADRGVLDRLSDPLRTGLLTYQSDEGRRVQNGFNHRVRGAILVAIFI